MTTNDKLALLRESELYLMHLDGFEWNTGDASGELNLWYRTKDKDFSSFFEIFAQDGTGGLFALWYKNGKAGNEKETLVAYFDSEGQLAVAATGLDEFLSLMATGVNLYDFVFYNRKSFFNDFTKDPDAKAEKEEYQSKFLGFLKGKLSILPAVNPDEIRNKGETQLPELQSWLEKFIK